MVEHDRLKETMETTETVSNVKPSSDAFRQELVVVQARRILVNHLRRHQDRLNNYVEGFMEAREREIEIGRIWDRFFASPKVRKVLTKPDAWETISQQLGSIDPFGTVVKADADTELADLATRFDEELKEVKQKVEAGVWEDADTNATAKEVYRCMSTIRPAVSLIRVTCQNGARESLYEVRTTTNQIFEAVTEQLESPAGDDAPQTDAPQTKRVRQGEGDRESASTKSPVDQEAREARAATDRTGKDLAMESSP